MRNRYGKSPDPNKPLGSKAYFSIPHLPDSRRGSGDHGLEEEQANQLVKKTKSKHDTVVVQEKLDGSNVAIAKQKGKILPLIRAGYLANTSPYEQHHRFADWVEKEKTRFETLLQEGERCCGEWLIEAHGTRYALPHEPFVAFDLITGHKRTLTKTLTERCQNVEIITPKLIHKGGAISIEDVLNLLEPSGHGALDPVEGAVWRLERELENEVSFLGKYVRAGKSDGHYLSQISGNAPIYNTRVVKPNP
jgi:hypothetical protein